MDEALKLITIKPHTVKDLFNDEEGLFINFVEKINNQVGEKMNFDMSLVLVCVDVARMTLEILSFILEITV